MRIRAMRIRAVRIMGAESVEIDCFIRKIDFIDRVCVFDLSF